MPQSSQASSPAVKRRGPIRLAFGVLILTATVLLGLLAAIGSYELRSDPEYTSPPYIITLSVLVLLGAALSWWIIHVPGSPIPAMVSLIGGILLLLLSVAGVAIGGFAVDLALHFAAAGMGAAISIVGYSLVGVFAAVRLVSGPFRRWRKEQSGADGARDDR